MLPGTIDIDGNALVISCQPHVAIKLRRVFAGVQRQKAGVFTISASPAQAHELKWFAERYPMEVTERARSLFAELVETQERKLEAIAAMDLPGYVPREFELAIPPREYQRIDAELAIKTGQLLNASELGLGKTCMAIAALTGPGALPALVVTMTHLQRQWASEIARFAPKLRVHQIKKSEPYKFSATRVERVDGRRTVVQGECMPDVMIVSYQKAHGWVETLAGAVRSIVLDEAQEMRHNGTRKYDAVKAIADRCDMRIGLSATPIYNYGGEIHNVLGILAPDVLGTRKEFFDEWCGGTSDDQESAKKARVSDPAALGTYLREQGAMIRRTRKDVGRELPALTVVRHVVEADPDSINRSMESVAELAQRVLDRIGTNLERMQNAGELDYKLRQATGIAKARPVADFVRMLVESGERVVLFGWHHEVYRIWRDAFDTKGSAIPYAMYTGEESEAQKAASVARFISGEARIFIISVRAGAGLDGLQKICRTTVVGELDWSPQVHAQGIGRLHRDGQTEPVMAYYLVAEEGSDPVIAETLGLKEAQSRGILNPEEAANEAQLVGRADDHIRKLAESIIARKKGSKS